MSLLPMKKPALPVLDDGDKLQTEKALPPFVPQPCGVFNIPYAAGATSATFNAYANNDVLVELTETVTFTVTGVPGDMAIGGSN